MEYEEILEAWRKKKDLAKLAEYCLKDSELTLRLGEFILPQIFEISKISGQLPFDASRMTYSQLVEWYLSKKAFVMNHIIPNQPKWDEIQKRREYSPYVGGFVKEPIGGLHEEIAVMDFRSLYPSIIATFNISPETFNCSCCRKNGYEVPERKYWFCKKNKGFVSTVIKELIEKRSEIKKRMEKLKIGEEWNRLDREQFAVKTIANATYGYFGFSGSKWYCRECAESSAAFGRFFIKKVIDEAEKEGFTIIYADTDSMFAKVKGNLEKKTQIFLKKINKILPGMIELDLQGIYLRGIFIPRGVGPGTAKKRYALIDEKGVLTVRGLEKVRRDWSNVAKQTQEKVLKLVLEKKDVKGSVKYVQNIIKELKQGKIPLKDLTIHEQLTKSLSEYKAIGPHVAAARKIKERGRPIGEGMVIMFAITKGKGSISERAEPMEDIKINDIDNDYYISHQIVPAALRVLTVLGVTEEELLGQSLKSFLKK
jgi:DNA polymerase Pol2